MTRALEDGYVECGECGHPIEQHGLDGCDIDRCPCVECWTKTEIVAVRRREGLPGRWQL